MSGDNHVPVPRCERCKQRKSRCNRQYPSCQRCEAENVQCEYSSRRKPGFPAGYRQILEAKISRLETEVKTLREANDAGATQHRPALVGSGLNVDVQDPSSPAMNPYCSDSRSLIEQPPPATSTMTRQISEQKPPADLVVSLISLFFRHIYPWLPFLDTQHVFSEMGAMDEPSLLYYALFGVSLPYSFDSRLDQASSDSFWKYTKRRIFIEIMEEPSCTSLEALTLLTLDLSGMTNGPQVWGTLAVATKLAAQLKTVHGHVLRLSAEDRPNNASIEADEMRRRRLFWAIYALDCYISITTSYPSTLTELSIQHFLPTQKATWGEYGYTPNMDSNQSESSQTRGLDTIPLNPMSVFGYQLELLDISRRLHRLYIDYITLSENDDHSPRWLERFGRCEGDISVWFHTIPRCLLIKISNQPPVITSHILPSVVLLNVYYHGLTIYLHGLTAYASQQILQLEHSDIRTNSQDICMRSVDALVYICSTFIDKVDNKIGWPFTWSIWVAARCLLASEYNGCGQTAPHFDTLLEYLRKMGKYWQISRKYLRLLCQAEAELKNGRSSGDTTSSPGLLPFIVDMRIATCDLEDRFRVDPLLSQAAPPGGQTTPFYGDPSLFEWRPGETNLDTILPAETCFGLQGQPSDNWFTMPLVASSAYEQFPSSSFCNSSTTEK
ncbi:hypothetical protein N7517_004599 [Penicillium concentricum]|uniref:Zn(2)-C6 fungal-type domain-containing protein n=1 Tax=Penicillium concentricum TaxID=293559 RepID=A0A9W9V8B3_9EURO|nr:uncharacterized protein N7517_004599 [Penicillium concentricum]KAJ5372593.1 hypothetical protein N7517_004599 [Penicillium concentricum]